MVAVFSALGLLPSLVIPSMAVRMQNPFPLVLIGFFSFVIAFTGLLLAPMKAPLLWACLLGVGPSTFPLALTLINLRTRTPTGSAALSGFMQGVGYSFSCLGRSWSAGCTRSATAGPSRSASCSAAPP